MRIKMDNLPVRIPAIDCIFTVLTKLSVRQLVCEVHLDSKMHRLKGTVALDGFFDYIIVSKILVKDLIFFYFGELWLLLAYSESAPRFLNYL
jgi:hypothetical protein